MYIEILKAETIKHYDRMIEWAEKQIPFEKPDPFLMEIAIGEDWFSNHCPFCKAYHKEDGTGCFYCPLKTNNYMTCCDNRWEKMYRARRWSTWIRYAKSVREFIRKI